MAERKLRSENAADIGELADAVNTSAHPIQVLTLRNGELEEENERLRRQLEGHAGNNAPWKGRWSWSAAGRPDPGRMRMSIS
ncbi:hypothetical protein OIE66_17850 [Nonomuraea sp. NBC_01738]|uniref:hypothetical protein n=1 Tax=Nonomuraea sp. NBC_01738 TaxID=2976003 RepID=UPI002E106686|nr:hypothetical protein OIE66_17850 [Nonomuraea sp. NBC_01738]